jgi:hypothetical protein
LKLCKLFIHILCYLCSTVALLNFRLVIPDAAQGGDFTNKDGTGGRYVFPRPPALSTAIFVMVGAVFAIGRC